MLYAFSGNNGQQFQKMKILKNWSPLRKKNPYKDLDLMATTGNGWFLVAIFIEMEAWETEWANWLKTYKKITTTGWRIKGSCIFTFEWNSRFVLASNHTLTNSVSKLTQTVLLLPTFACNVYYRFSTPSAVYITHELEMEPLLLVGIFALWKT